MKFKRFLFFILFMFLALPISAEKSILFITDNIFMADSFKAKYMKTLQNFIDKDFGKGKIVLKDFSKFNINTTQCIELCNMLHEENNLEAVILMVGLSNYYNLYGFSSYMKSTGNYKHTVREGSTDIYEINNKISNLYSSTKETLIGMVYKEIMGKKETKIFRPKVIPNFYVLNNNFSSNGDILFSIETYRKSLELIKMKKFKEAKKLLRSALEQNPAQSMLYYALGSVYLAENKDDSQLKALQCFEEGILVEPLNSNNICYKGLALMYIMYKGEITTEVLYFTRELGKYLAQTNEYFDAILNINIVDYDKKIQYINNWILSDISKLEKIFYKSNIKLIFLSYPEEIEINNLIYNYVKNSSRIKFLDTNVNNKNNSDSDANIMAEKIYKFLKENKILKNRLD